MPKRNWRTFFIGMVFINWIIVPGLKTGLSLPEQIAIIGFMRILTPTFVILTVAIIAPEYSSQAGLTAYFSQSQWLAAVGGTNGLTVFSFQGPTEAGGKYAVDPSIVPSYASQGIQFLPFIGATNYPELLRGQQFQISAPNHDGLMANVSSPNPTSDLEGRAIRFNFDFSARSVGLFFNIGDGGYLEAFDSSGGLIGQTGVSASGGFVGVVADTDIFQIHVVNTFSSDITYGIWDLQFPQAPVLHIQPGNPGAKITWPTPVQNYVLQSTSQLVAPNWQTVTNVPATNGNIVNVIVNTGASQQFYRLQKQ